ncbi:hypothetical protein DW797_09380 [Ruminococcus sp. AM31-32]|nr:hypothetical protein DW797_09380 [Ruminococcus sp. AM31-32]
MFFQKQQAYQNYCAFDSFIIPDTNFAITVNICRAYLKHGGNETETMLLIQKYLTPVRYNRNYPIHLRPKRNGDFMYRVA